MTETAINTGRRIIAAILCAVLLIFSVTAPASALTGRGNGELLAKKVTYDDIKDSDTESMREQLEDLKEQQKVIQSALNAALAQQADYEQTRELYVTMKALYEDQINTLEMEQILLEEQVKDIGKDIADSEEEYEKTYQNFLSMMRLTYEDGETNYLELILGASSLSDFFARIENVNGLLGYSNRLMERLDEEQRQLRDNREKMTRAVAEKESAVADLEQKQIELEEWTRENEAALAAIAIEIEEKKASVGELADEIEVKQKEFDTEVQRQIEAETKRIKAEEEKARQKALEEAARKQKYMWPLPTQYRTLSSYFNDVRTINSLGYVNKVHYGIDIPAPSGTAIYAAKDGKVITSTYHYSYGNYIVLEHADGTQTVYAHCSKLLVKAGTYVKQGQNIAKVGTTGSSTGNHLHFEVRSGGKSVNPLNYVKIP